MASNTPTAYDQYKSHDPFPDIPPALLNSADLTDYIRTVQLVEPFIPKNLKSASYEVPFSGTVYWWNPDTKNHQRKEIKSRDDVFTLESNSIAFIHLDTNFFLPDYIAVRFNLRITHVHQGLLLGTGPLVDPGFCGRLLVPLHNLTANKYTFTYGNGFIWVEFTKLSPNERWIGKAAVRRIGVYVPFPEDKKSLDPDSYFKKAVGGQSIVSSIPHAMREAKEEATNAAKSAKIAEEQAQRATKRLDRNLIIAGVTVLITVAVTIVGSGLVLIQIFQSTLDSKTKATEEITKTSIDVLRRDIEALRADLAKPPSVSRPIDITIKTRPGESSTQQKNPKIDLKK